MSIIIPTKNRADTLHIALDSVLSQTYENWEAIIILDGCTDGTERLIDAYAESRFTKIVSSPSRGASYARNLGIKSANGELIAFLDDDDSWHSDKLEKQIEHFDLNNPEVGLIYCWMDYFDLRGRLVYQHNPVIEGFVFEEMLTKQAIGGCPSIIIKKEVVENVGLFDESLLRGNDGDYWRRITEKYKVQVLKEALVKVQVGRSDRISLNSVKNLTNSLVALEKWLKVYGPYYDKFPEKRLVMLFKCLSVSLTSASKDKTLIYLKEILKIKGFFKIKIKLSIIVLYKFLFKRGIL